MITSISCPIKKRVKYVQNSLTTSSHSSFFPLQQGKLAEAEVEFEKLLGMSHVKTAMAELSKVDRLDETDSVNFAELIYGRHFRGRYEILKSNYESFMSLF